jgi:hypothetical protein
MRATEFIDFLNRESVVGCEDYSHLEIWEEDKDGKIKIKKGLAGGIQVNDKKGGF